MVKEIVSLISFPLCLFSVHRKATEVCVLILYPATLLKAIDCHSGLPTAEGATFTPRAWRDQGGCVTLLSSTIVERKVLCILKSKGSHQQSDAAGQPASYNSTSPSKICRDTIVS